MIGTPTTGSVNRSKWARGKRVCLLTGKLSEPGLQALVLRGNEVDSVLLAPREDAVIGVDLWTVSNGMQP